MDSIGSCLLLLFSSGSDAIEIARCDMICYDSKLPIRYMIQVGELNSIDIED